MASDVVPAPTLTPSIGSGNASAAVAAARRPVTPATSAQPGGFATSEVIAAAIPAGAAMLALAVGGSAAVRDRAVSQELARVGASDSSLQVVWSGVPAQASVPVSRLDSGARRALTSIVSGRPFGVSLFRQAQF